MFPMKELVTGLLKELVQVLDLQACDGTSAGATVARWEDDQFVYFEAGLSRENGEFMDVCIHQGRVFIRLARPSAGPMVPQ